MCKAWWRRGPLGVCAELRNDTKPRDFQEQASRSGSFRVRQQRRRKWHSLVPSSSISHTPLDLIQRKRMTEICRRVTEGQPHIRRGCQCLTSLSRQSLRFPGEKTMIWFHTSTLNARGLLPRTTRYFWVLIKRTCQKIDWILLLSVSITGKLTVKDRSKTSEPHKMTHVSFLCLAAHSSFLYS